MVFPVQWWRSYNWARAKQLTHWFLGGKGLGIQQGTSVWVGSTKSYNWLCFLQVWWDWPFATWKSGATGYKPRDSIGPNLELSYKAHERRSPGRSKCLRVQVVTGWYFLYTKILKFYRFSFRTPTICLNEYKTTKQCTFILFCGPSRT